MTITTVSDQIYYTYANLAMADYAVSFIECLCHTKGTWAGKKFELIEYLKSKRLYVNETLTESEEM